MSKLVQLAASSILVLFSLHATAGDHKHMKMDHSQKHSKKMMHDSGKKKTLSESDKKAVENLFVINEELHSSFFTYDAKKAEKTAAKLATAIDKIKNKEVQKALDLASKNLKSIKASASREDNNKKYHQVSMTLIDVLKTFELSSAYASYSCPMVKKKWVQNTNKMAKVHNPYAPEMPHCGGKD